MRFADFCASHSARRAKLAPPHVLALRLYTTSSYALFNEPPGGHNGQHYGILLIELGVLLAVAGSMLSIFYAFAGRVTEIKDEDW